MALRTVALYQDPETGRTEYIGIESIYTVDGKGNQINIPDKIDSLREKSKNHRLFCPCGCGANLILVAGDKNLREQHYRIWEDGIDHKCHAEEEGVVSIYSKVVLKCWMDEKLQDPDIQMRVPIRQVDSSVRKYEFSFLSLKRGIALSYTYMRENLSDEKIGILENNKRKIRVFYVADSCNGGCNGQYPEWLMKIQRVQGYCLLLSIAGKEYAKAKMKAVYYAQDLDERWVEQKIAEGTLRDYWFDHNGYLLFRNRILTEMKLKAESSFRKEQNLIRSKREEKDRRRKEEQERIRKQILLREQEKRRKQEAEEARKRREEEQKLEEEKRFRAHLPELLNQQETQVRDSKGNRWIKCEYCGRILPEEKFSSFGGLCRMNLGTCRECNKNNPAAGDIIKPVFRKRRESKEGNICPICGGSLLKRNGKYGTFWGCSNYPRCRFTKNS